VNPECYHKMCLSCVDRIFAHGPAQCPIPGCNRTLRKHRFRTQTFEDIRVEREVDIRKRVAQVFNKRQEDFEDLRAYNDYLNDVEDITFNLVEGIDVEDSNDRLEAYRTKHADEIANNQHIAQDENTSYEAHKKQDERQARMRRKAALREKEDDRKAAAESKRDMLNRLATGNEDAATIAKEAPTLSSRASSRARHPSPKRRSIRLVGFAWTGSHTTRCKTTTAGPLSKTLGATRSCVLAVTTSWSSLADEPCAKRSPVWGCLLRTRRRRL
jgi:CDK-activating kinase assembly factor MAT1